MFCVLSAVDGLTDSNLLVSERLRLQSALKMSRPSADEAAVAELLKKVEDSECIPSML